MVDQRGAWGGRQRDPRRQELSQLSRGRRGQHRDLVASGEKLEPNPVDWKPGTLKVTAQTRTIPNYLYLKLSRQERNLRAHKATIEESKTCIACHYTLVHRKVPRSAEFKKAVDKHAIHEGDGA